MEGRPCSCARRSHASARPRSQKAPGVPARFPTGGARARSLPRQGVVGQPCDLKRGRAKRREVDEDPAPHPEDRNLAGFDLPAERARRDAEFTGCVGYGQGSVLATSLIHVGSGVSSGEPVVVMEPSEHRGGVDGGAGEVFRGGGGGAIRGWSLLGDSLVGPRGVEEGAEFIQDALEMVVARQEDVVEALAA